MEKRVDELAAVHQHLAGRRPHGLPHLRRLGDDAEVHLVARVGRGVEAVRFPAAPVAQGEGARHDRLRQQRLQLVGATRAQLQPQHARDVRIDRQPIHRGEAAARPEDPHAPAVAAAVHHREAVLGHVDDRHAAVRLRPRRVRPHQLDAGPGAVRHRRPGLSSGDRGHRLAGAVIGDEQLAVSAEPHSRGARHQPDPDLGLRPREGRRRTVAPRRQGGEETNERALRQAPRRAARL